MSIIPDIPVDPNRLETEPAQATLEMTFALRTQLPAPITPSLLVARKVVFDVDAYLPWFGTAVAEPSLMASMRTISGIGSYTYDDPLVDPTMVEMPGATRWIPGADYIEAAPWAPYDGDDSLTWTTPGPGTAPRCDLDYSYDRNDDLELTRSALVFDGGKWLQLGQPGYVEGGFTVIMAAVLHAGGGHYGIVETGRPDVLSDTMRSIALQWRAGMLQVISNGKLVDHPLTVSNGRAVIIGLSASTRVGNLVVLERTRTTRSFSLRGAEPWDATLYLGRMRESETIETTAVMELLEFAYWPVALDIEALEGFAKHLNAAYGVSR